VIAPTSPAGKLLTLGWKAVPALLDELDDPNLIGGRRAWILSVLFSITSWNDPRSDDGVLGNFQSYDVGWQIVSGANGKMSSVSMGWGSSATYNTRIDETKQRDFAKRWREFRNYIVVQDK
jgi:hypothetical protein